MHKGKRTQTGGRLRWAAAALALILLAGGIVAGMKLGGGPVDFVANLRK